MHYFLVVNKSQNKIKKWIIYNKANYLTCTRVFSAFLLTQLICMLLNASIILVRFLHIPENVWVHFNREWRSRPDSRGIIDIHYSVSFLFLFFFYFLFFYFCFYFYFVFSPITGFLRFYIRLSGLTSIYVSLTKIFGH